MGRDLDRHGRDRQVRRRRAGGQPASLQQHGFGSGLRGLRSGGVCCRSLPHVACAAPPPPPPLSFCTGDICQLRPGASSTPLRCGGRGSMQQGERLGALPTGALRLRLQGPVPRGAARRPPLGVPTGLPGCHGGGERHAGARACTVAASRFAIWAAPVPGWLAGACRRVGERRRSAPRQGSCGPTPCPRRLHAEAAAQASLRRQQQPAAPAAGHQGAGGTAQCGAGAGACRAPLPPGRGQHACPRPTQIPARWLTCWFGVGAGHVCGRPPHRRQPAV